MNIIRKGLKVPMTQYLDKHLTIINQMLPRPLTPTQLKVLAAFMSLDGDLAKYPFSTTGRRVVREKLDMTSQAMYPHLEGIKSKGLIEGHGKSDAYPIRSFLFPNREGQLYQFKLEINE